MLVVLCLCVFLSRPSYVTPLTPDDTILSKFANSPLQVHDWPSIGRSKLNRHIAINDPKGICCTTNYSVVWDSDDELIVFAADNFFCPTTIATLNLDALDPDRLWEIFRESLNRVHKKGAALGEKYYVGNYPGVTSWPVHYDILMAMRRCLTPFATIILDAEQQKLRHQLLDRKLTSIATNVADKNDLADLSWHHTRESNHQDDAEEEEEEDDDEDQEEDDDEIIGNPILPMWRSAFWASAALPASNLTSFHSAPHTDGTSPGLASVFTLTSDSKYEVSGTTFNKVAGDIAIVHNEDFSQGVNLQDSLIQTNALLNEESAEEGWLNQTRNRFSEIIVLAFNKFNRMIIYPSNRYHTAFIPNSSLLNDDPRKGRLTMNTFWETYEMPGLCETTGWIQMISNHKQGYGLHEHSRSSYPRNGQEVVNTCSACKTWQTLCNWCPYTASCQDLATFDENCPSQSMSGIEFNPLDTETTCDNAGALLGSCLEHTSCNTCSDAGCAWCISTGRCLRDIKRACSDKNEHVGEHGFQKCDSEFTPHDCTQHTVCHTCTDSGRCTWCPTNKKCKANVDYICGEDEKKDNIVGKFGHGTCPEVTMDRALKEVEEIMIDLVDCVSPLSCGECLQVDGCSWCMAPGSASGECINFPLTECPNALKQIVTNEIISYGDKENVKFENTCPLLQLSEDALLLESEL